MTRPTEQEIVEALHVHSTVACLCAIELIERLDKKIAALRARIADATSPEGVERAWKAYCTNGSCSPSVSTLSAIKAALGEDVTNQTPPTKGTP